MDILPTDLSAAFLLIFRLDGAKPLDGPNRIDDVDSYRFNNGVSVNVTHIGGGLVRIESVRGYRVTADNMRIDSNVATITITRI